MNNAILRNEPPPPWHLICKEAVRGRSLESLARQYSVSVEAIQTHLDRALDASDISHGVRIRSNAEIKSASDKARNDLVSFLQEAIDELRSSDKPKLDQLPHFQALLASAARLFAWPSVSITRAAQPTGNFTVSQADSAAHAVNLALIATPPEQLARLALSHLALQQPPSATPAEQTTDPS